MSLQKLIDAVTKAGYILLDKCSVRIVGTEEGRAFVCLRDIHFNNKCEVPIVNEDTYSDTILVLAKKVLSELKPLAEKPLLLDSAMERIQALCAGVRGSLDPDRATSILMGAMNDVYTNRIKYFIDAREMGDILARYNYLQQIIEEFEKELIQEASKKSVKVEQKTNTVDPFTYVGEFGDSYSVKKEI
jgi:hypothetical protein